MLQHQTSLSNNSAVLAQTTTVLACSKASLKVKGTLKLSEFLYHTYKIHKNEGIPKSSRNAYALA